MIKGCDVTRRFVLGYSYILVFLFLFSAYSEEYLYDKIVVPHVGLPMPLDYLVLAISALVFVCLAYIQGLSTIRLDAVAMLLFLRVVFFSFPIFYSEEAIEGIGRFAVVMAPFLAYVIALNSKVARYENLDGIFIVLGVVVLVQLIYTVQQIDYTSLINQDEVSLLKKIPIGSTNVIAGYFTPVALFMLVRYSKRKVLRIVILACSVLGIYLTGSSAAWFVLLFGILLWRFCVSVGRNKKIMFAFGISAMIVVVCILPMYLSDIGANGLSHGRFEIWTTLLYRSMEAPIFGHGLSFSGHEQAHNILIDTLYQGGIVGLIILIAAIIKIFKSLGFKDCLPLVIYLAALFLYQCEETCYFDCRGDILFWLMAGFAMSIANTSRKRMGSTTIASDLKSICDSDGKK